MELDIDLDSALTTSAEPGDNKSVSTNINISNTTVANATTTMTIKNEDLDDHMVPVTMTTTTEIVQPSNESTSPEVSENDHQWGKYSRIIV